MTKAGKTTLYNFPLADQLNRKLVRTDTYPDGNCFFHALLTAIDQKFRHQSSHFAHLKLVKEFRKNLGEWLTFDRYQSLGKGEFFRLNFLSALNEMLDEWYDNSNSAYTKVLKEVIPRQFIDSDIFPMALAPQSDNFYVTFCEKMEERSRTLLRPFENEKVQAFCSWMHSELVRLFESAHKHSFESFRAKLGKMGEYADALQMECIARYVGYNFLFIREEEEKAYEGLSSVVNFDPSRQCVIFLWVGENHFEVVGELEGKNLINRIFQSSDPLIAALQNQSEHPIPNNANNEDAIEIMT